MASISVLDAAPPFKPSLRPWVTHATVRVTSLSPRTMPRSTATKSPSPAELLATVPVALRRLAERGVVRTYRKGTIVLEEGTTSDAFYIVLAGQAKAFSCDERGREVTYGVHGPGDYFGEMSLDGGPRSASIMATAPLICSLLTRQSLRLHVAEEPDFAFELIARVIGRARRATEQQRSLALESVYGRVRRLLESLATATPDTDGCRVVAERLTHAEMAARVGCSREMVSKLMKDLVVGGYVSVAGTKMRLLKKLPSNW